MGRELSASPAPGEAVAHRPHSSLGNLTPIEFATKRQELETLEKVTEKIDKLTVFGGLEGVLKDVVRIQVPSA